MSNEQKQADSGTATVNYIAGVSRINGMIDAELSAHANPAEATSDAAQRVVKALNEQENGAITLCALSSVLLSVAMQMEDEYTVPAESVITWLSQGAAALIPVMRRSQHNARSAH